MITPAALETLPRERTPAVRGSALTLAAAICTHGRPDKLRHALTSLMLQDQPADEIVVVDNAPADDATAMLLAREFPAVRHVVEDITGLGGARQRAMVETNADIVAFIDDDAMAEPDWAAALRTTFAEDTGLAACMARVRALQLTSAGARLFEANGGFDRGPDRIRLPMDSARPLHGRRAPLIAWAVSIGCGASFAVRRERALEVGGFDRAFGLGALVPGSEEHDLVWRLLVAGHCVSYDPFVRVRHEHREDGAAAGAQLGLHQRSLLAMLTKALLAADGAMRREILAFLGWRLLKPAVRLVRSAFGRDPIPTQVLWRMWGHCFAGVWLCARHYRPGRRP